MKNIIIFLLFVFTSLTCSFAQNENAWKEGLQRVSQENLVRLEVDFSQASIHSMTEDDFAIYEPSYCKHKFTVIGKLADSFNDSKRLPFIIGNFPKASYILKVRIISVDSKGNMNSTAEFLDKDGKLVAKVGEIYGDGGTFGSKMNLMGDGFKSTGKALSKQVKKLLKRAKK